MGFEEGLPDWVLLGSLLVAPVVVGIGVLVLAFRLPADRRQRRTALLLLGAASLAVAAYLAGLLLPQLVSAPPPSPPASAVGG